MSPQPRAAPTDARPPHHCACLKPTQLQPLRHSLHEVEDHQPHHLSATRNTWQRIPAVTPWRSGHAPPKHPWPRHHHTAAEIVELLKSGKHLDAQNEAPSTAPRQSVAAVSASATGREPPPPHAHPAAAGHRIRQAPCRIRSRRASPLRAGAPAGGHLEAARRGRARPDPVATVITGRASFPATCSSGGEAEGGGRGWAAARVSGRPARG